MNENSKNYSNPKLIAEKLLWPLWRGIDSGFKKKYKRDIWTHFENNIRSAAYTGKLSRFLNNIIGYLGIEIQAQFIDDIQELLQSNQDDEILSQLRDNSTLCVLYVRQKNEEWKSEFKEEL